MLAYNKLTSSYNKDQDEIWLTGWACFIAATLLVIGVVLAAVWAANAEKKARREMMPASYAAKWINES